MDQLPCEILEHILRYIDQPLDLFRMSCVCQHWQAIIMTDEYFLNQWFFRLLQRSQDESSTVNSQSICGSPEQPVFNIVEPSFPISLRSSKCYLLPWVFRGHVSYLKKQTENYNPFLSFCYTYHSFSFWLFLPRQCQLHIRIGICNVKSLNILLNSNENYHLVHGGTISIADRWIHIVLGKIVLQSYYQIWIDGQHLSKVMQFQKSFDDLFDGDCSLFSIFSFWRLDNNPLGTSNRPCIVDPTAFKRCLTLVEIWATHQQQTSINQVKVGTDIKNNNWKAECR